MSTQAAMPALLHPLPLCRPAGQRAQALHELEERSGQLCRLTSYCPIPQPSAPFSHEKQIPLQHSSVRATQAALFVV